MENFTWVPIYKKLVRKILEFKNNRKELVRIMYEILDELDLFREDEGCNLDSYKGVRCKYDDFDPFSFLNRFNFKGRDDAINGNKEFIKKFQEKTGMDVEVPKDFDGIPSTQYQTSCYIRFKEERDAEDINDLWDLFEVAIRFSEENNWENRQEFIRLYDQAIAKPYCSFNISIGLFKIAPNFYLSLDSNSKENLKKNYHFQMSNFTAPSGEEYLKIIEQVQKLIQESDVFHSLLDFSRQSWLNKQEESIQEENAREEFTHSNSIQKDTKNYFWLNTIVNEFSFADKEVGYTKEFSCVGERNRKPNFSIVQPGDALIIYEATPTLKIIGHGRIYEKCDNGNLMIEMTHKFETPILYSVIKNHPDLKNASFLLSPHGTLLKLRYEEYKTILKEISRQNPGFVYTWEDMKNEVFLEEKDYKNIVRVLQKKKNIILEGAPGVGKTYIVEKLVHTLMEVVQPYCIEYVQFHQSYSYEDFVMGYRPTQDGGFALKKGIFLEFCEKAKKNPNNNYYFIIDEINRGNLSKIFGELLMLIESDKRESVWVKLAYQKEEKVLFTVPKNIYIIGLMNTADRSLAILDYALRRRFAFFTIPPLFASPKFQEYVDDLKSSAFKNLIAAIEGLNNTIKNDESLGEGFKIGHSYFSNLKEIHKEVLEDILSYEIKPILKEYWYDDADKVDEEMKRLYSAIGA